MHASGILTGLRHRPPWHHRDRAHSWGIESGDRQRHRASCECCEQPDRPHERGHQGALAVPSARTSSQSPPWRPLLPERGHLLEVCHLHASQRPAPPAARRLPAAAEADVRAAKAAMMQRSSGRSLMFMSLHLGSQCCNDPEFDVQLRVIWISRMRSRLAFHRTGFVQCGRSACCISKLKWKRCKTTGGKGGWIRILCRFYLMGVRHSCLRTVTLR